MAIKEKNTTKCNDKSLNYIKLLSSTFELLILVLFTGMLSFKKFKLAYSFSRPIKIAKQILFTNSQNLFYFDNSFS